MKRIGIYGGSFCPVHNGHLHAATDFLNQLKLDTLLIIPALTPPHKTINSDLPEHRMNMLRLAFSSLSEYNKSIFVSDYEFSRGGISYTVDTLKHFHKPENKLYMLCGTDMFLCFDKWKEPETISSLCDLVFVPRRNATEAELAEIERKKESYAASFGTSTITLDHKPIEISSSEIRKMIAQGDFESAAKFLDPKVIKYIIENRLYQNED